MPVVGSRGVRGGAADLGHNDLGLPRHAQVYYELGVWQRLHEQGQAAWVAGQLLDLGLADLQQLLTLDSTTSGQSRGRRGLQ